MRALKPIKEVPQRRMATPVTAPLIVPTIAPLSAGAIVGPWSTRKLAVKGRVIDEEGRGIFQATVMLEGNTGQRRVLTGADGSFTLVATKVGRFRVRVEKAGLTTVKVAITVPQTTPQTIRMRQRASCELLVRLQSEDGQPFVGDAKVLIRNASGRRLESIQGRSQATFSLPPGDFTIAVVSPEAGRISPSVTPITLRAGSSARPTLTFMIFPVPVLRNPGVQLLGFVCRRVPACPKQTIMGGDS